MTQASNRLTDRVSSSGGAAFATTGRISWAIPDDWERREVHDEGTRFYAVRVTVGSALTAGTAVGQLLTVRPPDGLRRVAAHLALAHICRGKRLDSQSPTLWESIAAGYQKAAESLYDSLRRNGGITLDMDNSGTVDVSERHLTGAVRLQRA